jgi:hypothetical protein
MLGTKSLTLMVASHSLGVVGNMSWIRHFSSLDLWYLSVCSVLSSFRPTRNRWLLYDLGTSATISATERLSPHILPPPSSTDKQHRDTVPEFRNWVSDSQPSSRSRLAQSFVRDSAAKSELSRGKTSIACKYLHARHLTDSSSQDRPLVLHADPVCRS